MCCDSGMHASCGKSGPRLAAWHWSGPGGQGAQFGSRQPPAWRAHLLGLPRRVAPRSLQAPRYAGTWTWELAWIGLAGALAGARVMGAPRPTRPRELRPFLATRPHTQTALPPGNTRLAHALAQRPAVATSLPCGQRLASPSEPRSASGSAPRGPCASSAAARLTRGLVLLLPSFPLAPRGSRTPQGAPER
jgi:hypothetical protein